MAAEMVTLECLALNKFAQLHVNMSQISVSKALVAIKAFRWFVT